MKIICLIVCFLFTTLTEAQYQSLNVLEKAKQEIEKAEQQKKAKLNQIETDMTTDKVENKTEEDDLIQEETKN